MKFNISRRLVWNLTGFDIESVTLEAGEHEVAATPAVRLAAWLERNPEFGSVIDEGTTGGGGVRATRGALVVPPDEAPRGNRRVRK